MLKVKYHSVSDCVLSGHCEDYRIERPIYRVDQDGMVAAAVEMIEKFDLDSVDVSDMHTGEVYMTVYDDRAEEVEEDEKNVWWDDVDESFYDPYMGCDCYE